MLLTGLTKTFDKSRVVNHLAAASVSIRMKCGDSATVAFFQQIRKLHLLMSFQ